jgi:hypothetical protein
LTKCRGRRPNPDPKPKDHNPCDRIVERYAAQKPILLLVLLLKRHAEFEGFSVEVESTKLPAPDRRSGTAWLAVLETEVSQVGCKRETN